MRHFLSILLISIYLISFTEVHQLLKMPVLVEHFIEHRQLTNDLTFFEFLSLHYNSEVAHDSDDMQLPFKDFGHCVAVQTMVIPSSKIELKEKASSESFISHSVFYKKFVVASHLSEIWQPPRI